MLIPSVIKEVGDYCEAASKISEETKFKYSDVPWKDIVGMRNRLIHNYFDVNIDLVWNTVKIICHISYHYLKKILPNDK